ncbi:hypothetical protein ACHAXT_013261 [Thalassiosira profunda]
MKTNASPELKGGGASEGASTGSKSRRAQDASPSSLSHQSSSPSLLSTSALIPPTQPWQPKTKRRPSRSGGTTLRASPSPNFARPSSMPSYGSMNSLGRMRRMRREMEGSEGSARRRNRSASISEEGAAGRSSGGSSPRLSRGGSSPRLGGLQRSGSNPFLQKPLHLASTESLPLLLAAQQQIGSEQSVSERSKASSNATPVTEQDEQSKHLHAPPVASANQVHRHLTLPDLIAVGVGGTLGTGIFVLSSLLASSYAGPASTFCWLLSAAPALLSGFCFAELAGQIPAAGSTYAYVYASMGELPAVVAAGCLSLEYLVSASAIARGWGDKVAEWIVTMPENEVDDYGSWVIRKMLLPGLTFNTMAFLLCTSVGAVLLGGVKESKAVTNVFCAFKVVVVVAITLIGFGLMDAKNLKPLLPSELGVNGFFSGGTLSFMGYLGYDEVTCLTAEAIEPQRNMPRAIMWTIAILTACYMTATLALSGMLPYDQINSIGGFPDAFEARGLEWASSMAALGELLTLPLVVLVAVMAQPRLQFALACDGLMPEWFGRVDSEGNMRNGTLFACSLMAVIAGFVPLACLNDLISAGVLVSFSMANSSLVLLRHESPDNEPGMLERLLIWFNLICFAAALAMTHLWTSVFGKAVTCLFSAIALALCVRIWLACPAAELFGGKDRRTTTQHMTVGVKEVAAESFRTPLLPFVPCVGMFVNWYLVAQLTWAGLVALAVFLTAGVLSYFSFGYYFSVGNNGGWDSYESCGLSIHSEDLRSLMMDQMEGWEEDTGGYLMGRVESVVASIHEDDAEYDEAGASESDSAAQGLPIDDGVDDVQLDSSLVSRSF